MPERLFAGLRLRALTQMVWLTLALILMTGTPGSAFEQERRVALVITVGGYDFLPGLDNPVRDGQLIAKSLRDVGFEVTRIVDGSKAEILTALERFAFTSEVADVSLVYFAGHGFEFEGQNYLAPADTKADSRQIAQKGAIPLNHLTASVSRARQLRIIALDACRNDPFGAATGGITTPSVQSNETISIAESGARGTGGGLAVPPATRGTLISFAAAAGHVALDGEGSNSPYAVALSQALTAPDLEIGLSFRKLRDDVMETTRRLQVPHTYGSLSGNPYFLAGRSTQNNQLGKI